MDYFRISGTIEAGGDEMNLKNSLLISSTFTASLLAILCCKQYEEICLLHECCQDQEELISKLKSENECK